MSLLKRISRIIHSNLEDLASKQESVSQKSSSEPFEEAQSDSSANTHGHSSTAHSKMDNEEAKLRANLEVGPEAGLREIRASYKKLMRKYHPDLHANEESKQEVAAEISKQLNQAMNYFEKKLGAKNE